MQEHFWNSSDNPKHGMGFPHQKGARCLLNHFYHPGNITAVRFGLKAPTGLCRRNTSQPSVESSLLPITASDHLIWLFFKRLSLATALRAYSRTIQAVNNTSVDFKTCWDALKTLAVMSVNWGAFLMTLPHIIGEVWCAASSDSTTGRDSFSKLSFAYTAFLKLLISNIYCTNVGI